MTLPEGQTQALRCTGIRFCRDAPGGTTLMAPGSTQPTWPPSRFSTIQPTPNQPVAPGAKETSAGPGSFIWYGPPWSSRARLIECSAASKKVTLGDPWTLQGDELLFSRPKYAAGCRMSDPRS